MVSHKSEMAGPFNRGDTIINKHFTYYFTFVLNYLDILGRVTALEYFYHCFVWKNAVK